MILIELKAERNCSEEKLKKLAETTTLRQIIVASVKYKVCQEKPC